MRILRIKNYEKYQNHRAKDPRWVKLYRSILTDQAFLKLDPMSRYVYIGLLILASETGNNIVNDATYLCHRLAIPATQLNLKPLICSGLLVASLRTIQRQKSVSETESETEKRRDREEEIPQAPLREAVSKARGKTIFPEEWKLTEEDKAGWLRFGLNASVEFASFRDHALANDRRCANWPAAFRNWCRKSLALKERQYVPKVQ